MGHSSTRSLRRVGAVIGAFALVMSGCSESTSPESIATTTPATTTPATTTLTTTISPTTIPATTIPVTTAPPSSAATNAATTEPAPATTIPATTSPPASGPSSAPTTVPAGGDDLVSPYDLPDGDCFVATDEPIDRFVQPVPCNTPHLGQKLGVVDIIVDGDYTLDKAKEFTDPVCRALFEEFVQVDYDTSELFYVGVTPSPTGFAAGIPGLCFVSAESGLLDFDAEGYGR